MHIVCVGDCGIDHYLPANETRVGGISANFALQAKQCLGSDDSLRLIAPLGDDDAGHRVRQRFEGSGIDCDFIPMRGRTPVQHIRIDASGERHFVGYEEGVLSDCRIGRTRATALLRADLIVAPVFRQNRCMFESLLDVARRGLMAVDFADFREHPEPALIDGYIPDIDIGFFGLRADDEALIDMLRERAVDHDVLIVVTLGADGSLAFRGGDSFRCDAEPVDSVIDTTGAGDAFAAGFLCRYQRSGDIGRSLAAGATLAAAALQHLGGN
jgi:fructoselysine 6-kinase